jgi:CHAT domain-containing protein/tetratricopeptide (TPR) repeat protein
MRKIGTVVCLLALISGGGWLCSSTPSSKETPSPARDSHATVALTRMLDQAETIFQNGDYGNALDLFVIGYREAQRQKQRNLEACFLKGIGTCHFAQHHYQEALREYLAARDAFADLGDAGSVSTLNGGLSSLYLQLGEFDAAMDSIKRALAQDAAHDANDRRARHLIVEASLLVHSGNLDEAQELFHEAIAEAGRFDNPVLLSNAWDRLGSALLLRKRLREAEEALLEGYRIRKLNHLPNLAGSYGKLGLLRLEQGDLRSASALLDAAVLESKDSRGFIPQWTFYHARGRLRLSEGKLAAAHADFQLALELARNYRLTAPSSDATRVSMEGLVDEVYASFIDTGTRLYFDTGRSELARDTFEAVEENRGGSLAARLGERRQFRRSVTPAYWDALTKLQSAEADALLDYGEGPRSQMRRLRSSILEMEAKAGGAGLSLREDLLGRVQRSLDPDTVLLSFHLGEEGSRLWAVGASDLSLYRLPGRGNLIRRSRQFRQAVLTGDPSSEQLGRELYRTLFGGLKAKSIHKSRWLLSLDEGLFELPFAALVAGGTAAAPVYLIERHSIRIVSSAANRLDASKPNRIDGAFAGVGDAVYNAADSRWPGRSGERAAGWLASRLGWPWRASAAAPSTLGLSRLVGSGPEIEACAQQWRGGSVLLSGRDVTRENVRRVMETRPAVVHFATHIVQDQARSTNAMIALSLSGAGHDEFLSPAEIGGWNLEGGLVVLSGCSSGVAVARPASGLMGMTRAWLMAGASAVMATEWSTPDDVGVFFRRFYREMQLSGSHDPADALRAAQIETIQSRDWRSQPGFWAAYFVLGNY